MRHSAAVCHVCGVIFCVGMAMGTALWILQWTVMVAVVKLEPSPSLSPSLSRAQRRQVIQHRSIRLMIMNHHNWGGKAKTSLESCYSLKFPTMKLKCKLKYVVTKMGMAMAIVMEADIFGTLDTMCAMMMAMLQGKRRPE